MRSQPWCFAWTGCSHGRTGSNGSRGRPARCRPGRTGACTAKEGQRRSGSRSRSGHRRRRGPRGTCELTCITTCVCFRTSRQIGHLSSSSRRATSMSIMADWGCAGEERRAGALRGRRTRYTQPSLLARASPSPGARAEGLPVTSLRSRPHRPSWYRFVPLPSRSDDFRCGTTSAGAVSGGLGCARPAQPSFVAPRPTQVVGESCVCQTAAGVNGTVGVRGRLFGEAEGAKRPVTMRAMPGTAGRIASQESTPG